MQVFGIENGNGHQWRSCQARYRRYLYEVGEERDYSPANETRKARAGVSDKAAKKVQRRKCSVKMVTLA